MPGLFLTKHYREAAETLAAKYVKDATVTEVLDTRVPDMMTIEVEGDFEVFDPHAMDMWGGHFKFVFQDHEAKDEATRLLRGQMAMTTPELAEMFTSPTALYVYRQVVIRTTVERLVNGRVVKTAEPTATETVEWEDITREFHRQCMRSLQWR